MRPVVSHEGDEGGQVGELESHERALDEGVETVVVVVTVALERDWSWEEKEKEIICQTNFDLLKAVLSKIWDLQ